MSNVSRPEHALRAVASTHPATAGLSQAEFLSLATLRPRLVRILAARWSNPEDVAQDAYLRAWRERERFDRVQSTPWRWLLRIARWCAAHELRRRYDGTRPLFVQVEDNALVDTACDVERRIDGRRALAAYDGLPAFVAAAERVGQVAARRGVADARRASGQGRMTAFGTLPGEREIVDFIVRRVLDEGAWQMDVVNELRARRMFNRAGRPLAKGQVCRIVRAARVARGQFDGHRTTHGRTQADRCAA